MMPSVKVLAIAGTGKNGATLFSRLLGEIPGFVAVGEIGKVWDRGLVVGQPCSCGAPFRQCPFWSAVGGAAFGGWDAVDGLAMARLRDRVNSRRFAVPSLVAKARYRDRPDFRAYGRLMTALYRAILEVSGSTVIVDAHKRASHVWSISLVPDFEVTAIHLVRDPRGVALSNLREVVGSGILGDVPRLMRPPWRSAARWLLYNAEDELLKLRGIPMAQVLYERLIRDPGPYLVEACRSVGLAVPDRFGFLRNGEADLGSGHLLAGNRMRHTDGPTHLRADDGWSSALSARDQLTVVAITLPLFASYGYMSGW
jgi:hypothetical protein